MANGNPFFINPLGGQGPAIGQGLAGLGAIIGEQRQQDQAAKQRQQAQIAVQEAVASGDAGKVAQVMIQHPELQEVAGNAFGFTNEQTQAIAEQTYSQVLTNPESAQEILQRGIQQVKDAGGRPLQMTADLKRFIDDPEGAFKAVELGVASVAPKVYESYVKQKETQRQAELDALDEKRFGLEERRVAIQERQEKRLLDFPKGDESTAGIRDFEFYQNLKKENPGAADEFGRERGYVSSEGQELSSHLQKRLSVATDETITSERRSREYNNYADEIAASDFVGGKAGAWSEYLKEISGTQDAVSNLRKKYNAVKASQVVSNLPPGAASDKDIELALSGFPSDTANKQQVESFFRGLAKLEDQSAKFNNFKAEFISREGSERGMLRAWKREAQRKEAEQPAVKTAPQQAIDYLRQNPQFSEQFRAKYGYLPEGS